MTYIVTQFYISGPHLGKQYILQSFEDAVDVAVDMVMEHQNAESRVAVKNELTEVHSYYCKDCAIYIGCPENEN